MGENVLRLKTCCFALAVGVWWAFSIFIFGILNWLTGWGAPWIELISSVYIGFSADFMGSIIGAVWGFVDGFIGGFILAWVYNFFVSKCCKSCSSDE